MKKILALCIITVLGFSFNVSAAEPIIADQKLIKDSIIIVTDKEGINLNKIDLSKSYTHTKFVVGIDGEKATITSTFIPADKENTRSSTATVGTWKSTFRFGLLNMSYKYDLSKYGTHWKISNLRSVTAGGLFTIVSNIDSDITRAISTSSFSAECEVSCDAVFFDNQWITIGSGHFVYVTTVTDSGIVDSNMQ
ncbi:MAG: hypothetical protein CVV00_07465 [Firmicutes bacterium HGW-Firmicutes-5]|nr:MAG: hypothetical protein CVV00_07465 [Firmicutes bacterium HGW-Firmicutes-5]